MKPATTLEAAFHPPFAADDMTVYIMDSHNQMICMTRAWGYLQYFENGAELQDQLHAFIAAAVNEKFERQGNFNV